MVLQHDIDRRKLLAESNGKAASMMEDFAKEKSKMLSEIQTQITVVEERRLQRDLDEIKSL
jgi:hypothetical protein